MVRLLQQTGGSITPMFRRNDLGEIVEVIPDRDEYVTPPRGAQCTLKISGISDVFELPDFNDPNKTVQKIRIEFEVLGGNGNWPKMSVGKRFTQIFSYTINGQRAKLNMLFSALLEKPCPPEIDLDSFIGTVFTASTTQTPKGYGEVVIDTILPVKDEDDPFALDE